MDTRTKLKTGMLLSLLAGSAMIGAGPIDPPAGPVAPTYKTLQEVEPRTALSLENTPGDDDSYFRITQPGSYYLTGNVTVPAGKHGIEIMASNVTIDLGGFRLGGTGNGSFCGIISRSGQLLGGMTGIIIRNGHISFFDDAGIRLGVTSQNDRAKGGVIENVVLRLNNTGLVTGDSFTLRNVVAESNQGIGISAFDGCTLVECIARNNAQVGIATNGGSVVKDCVASANGGNGMSIGVRSTVSACSAEGNGGDGFSLGSGCVVRDCTASSNADDGFAANGSSIRDCISQSNTGDGFQVQSGSSLVGCTSRINTGAGVRLATGDNRIDSNHLNANTGGGMDLANSIRNHIIRNTFSGHAAGNIWLNSNASNYFGDSSTGTYVNVVLN